MATASVKEESQAARKKPSALRSVIAGSTAGAVEIGEPSSPLLLDCEVANHQGYQPLHIPPNVCLQPSSFPRVAMRQRLTGPEDNSCEDKDAAQPPTSRRAKAAMAAIRTPMVRRVHDTDNRKLSKSRYS